jgi:hypothetical protein
MNEPDDYTAAVAPAKKYKFYIDPASKEPPGHGNFEIDVRLPPSK